VKDPSRTFTGSRFRAALRDREGRLREAASNLAFEGEGRAHRARPNARLRDEVKSMTLMHLAFADEVLTGEGEAVDTAAPRRWRAEANAEKAERFRKGR
jgi:excinuclease ABC subunit B